MSNILENKYLCVIGIDGKTNDFKVGNYNKDRDSFSFSNGSYGDTELFNEPKASNATYVMSATLLDEINDAGLLYQGLY